VFFSNSILEELSAIPGYVEKSRGATFADSGRIPRLRFASFGMTIINLRKSAKSVDINPE
jgi:hypothetical protein